MEVLRARGRTGLLVGLGSTVALLAVLGVYAAHTLNQLNIAEASEVDEYLHRHEHLSSARRSLTSATGAVHDYLLDSDTSAAPAHREQARRSWSEAVRALDAYKEVAASDASLLTDALDSQLSRYWKRADSVLEQDRDQHPDPETRSLLRELIPMRDDLFLTVDELGSRDRAELESLIVRTTEVVRRSEQRLWIAIVVTTLLALSVAAVTFRHLMGLERIAVARHQDFLKAASELERLSRRLLTVQEEERKAIARELHDDYGQRIARLLVELSFATKRADVSSDLRLSMQAMGDSLRNLAEDLQQMSRGLHSAVLDNIGLEAAIRSDCDGLLKRSGLSVDFSATGIPRHLPAQISLGLYRVFQEALKNALNHSQTDRIEVVLAAEGREIMLRVQDFGRGFDTGSSDQSDGLGLVSMRERILMIGGTFAVRSTPGRGTQVVAKLNLP